MNKVFKIKEDQLKAASIRQIKSVLLLVLAPVGIITYMGISNEKYSISVYTILIGGAGLYFIYLQKQKYLKRFRFVFDEEKVSQLISKEDSTLFSEFARARNEGKFGVKDEKQILYSNIDDIEFESNNEIGIFSKDNNILTNNGKIVIPPEIENYEEIKNFLSQFNNTSLKN